MLFCSVTRSIILIRRGSDNAVGTKLLYHPLDSQVHAPTKVRAYIYGPRWPLFAGPAVRFCAKHCPCIQAQVTVNWTWKRTYTYIWGNTYKTYLQPLYLLQKRSIRIVSPSGRLQNTLPLFTKLQILPLFDLITYSNLILAHRYFHRTYSVPPSFVNYLIKQSAVHQHNTRAQSFDFNRPFYRTNLSFHGFRSTGPREWNKLDPSLKKIDSISLFKSSLKSRIIQSLL